MRHTPSPTTPVTPDTYARAHAALLRKLRREPERVRDDRHRLDDEALIDRFGWGIPSRRVIRALADVLAPAPLLEVGAGVGLWARLLADAGLDIVATDLAPPAATWYPVHQAGAVEAVRASPDRTLLLIWPSDTNPMASQALAAYTGALLVVAGERPERIRGPGLGAARAPATGDAAFFAALARDWALVASLVGPQRVFYDDDIALFARVR